MELVAVCQNHSTLLLCQPTLYLKTRWGRLQIDNELNKHYEPVVIIDVKEKLDKKLLRRVRWAVLFHHLSL